MPSMGAGPRWLSSRAAEEVFAPSNTLAPVYRAARTPHPRFCRRQFRQYGEGLSLRRGRSPLHRQIGLRTACSTGSGVLRCSASCSLLSGGGEKTVLDQSTPQLPFSIVEFLGGDAQKFCLLVPLVDVEFKHRVGEIHQVWLCTECSPHSIFVLLLVEQCVDGRIRVWKPVKGFFDDPFLARQCRRNIPVFLAQMRALALQGVMHIPFQSFPE